MESLLIGLITSPFFIFYSFESGLKSDAVVTVLVDRGFGHEADVIGVGFKLKARLCREGCLGLCWPENRLR